MKSASERIRRKRRRRRARVLRNKDLAAWAKWHDLDLDSARFARKMSQVFSTTQRSLADRLRDIGPLFNNRTYDGDFVD